MTGKHPQELGLLACISLVVGNMVGSGIFLLPAPLASFGSVSLLAWVFSSAGALILALVFAKLSHQFPVVGGPYAYCREGLGDFVGFQIAFCYWVAMVIGNAATIVAMNGYLALFWPSLNTNHFLSFCVAAGAIWFIAIVNIIGIRETKWIQVITTFLKIIPLALITILGFFYIQADNFPVFNATGHSNFSALAGASMLTLWAFIGLESATVPAEYVKNPEKTIALSTVFGTLITAAIYMLCTFVVMGMIPDNQLAESSAPLALAGEKIFGSLSGSLIAIAAALSSFSATVGWMLLQGQVPLAAAQDGLFPSYFAKVNKKDMPHVSMIISSIFITLSLILNYHASLVNQFTFLVILATLGFLIPYLYTSVAAIVLFRRDRARFTKSQLIRALVLGIIAFIYSLFAIIGAGIETVFYGCLLLFACAPLYAFMKINKRSA